MAKLSPDQVAGAVPRLADGVDTEEIEGVIRLRGPQLRRGAIARTIARVLHLPSRVEVELDEIGTWMIERMDGRRLEELADELAAHLNLSVREAEAALTLFLQQLLQRKLVAIEFPEDVAA